MNKILEILGASVFWCVMAFVIIGSIAVVIKEGLIAIPHVAVGWFGVGFFIFCWYAISKKPKKTL